MLAEAMADFAEKSERPLIIICGTLTTKDTGAFLRPFKGLAQEVLAVPVDADQYGKPAQEVAAAAAAEGIPAAACETPRRRCAFCRSANGRGRRASSSPAVSISPARCSR